MWALWYRVCFHLCIHAAHALNSITWFLGVAGSCCNSSAGTFGCLLTISSGVLLVCNAADTIILRMLTYTDDTAHKDRCRDYKQTNARASHSMVPTHQQEHAHQGILVAHTRYLRSLIHTDEAQGKASHFSAYSSRVQKPSGKSGSEALDLPSESHAKGL